MKILILNPPSPGKSYINRDQMGGMGHKIQFGSQVQSRLISLFKSKFIHLPVVQLVYAASILSDKHTVKVIDATNDERSIKDTIPEIRDFKPDFTIMAVSSSDILFERDVVAKKIKEFTGSRIITVGDTIPNAPDLFKYPFDISIIGEIETKINDIVHNMDLAEVEGIIYLRNNKKIVNKPRKLLEGKELENLPFLKWDLFNYKKYTYYPLILKEPVATVLSSRGCPYACHYCSYSQNMGKKWRARSAENVVKEIKNNVMKYGFKGIVFRDPLFTFNRKRTIEICSKIKNLDILWVCETRPELLDIELLNLMYRSGCRGINIGIESIHGNELKNVGRNPIDRKKLIKTIHHAEKIGIRTTCYFILGLPGSSKSSIKEIIDFSLKLNPSHAEYKIATPYPGTLLYLEAKKKGWIISEDYSKLGGYSSSMQISKNISPEFLEKEMSEAFKNFYMRKEYISRELLRKDLFLKIWMLFKTSRKVFFS